MNARASKTIRALVRASSQSLDQGILDQMEKSLKKAYSRLSAPDKHPDKLEAALARELAKVPVGSGFAQTGSR